MNFSVSPELQKLGVKVKFAIFENANIVNKVSALEDYKKEIIEKLGGLNLSKNSILEAYRELHEISKVDFPPPAEGLIQLIKEKGRLPNISTVVDSYNIVSVETLLSIGAHNLDKIKGNLVIKFAEGNEHYVPLGNSELQKVNEGEYVCVDEEKVICWLDIRQCEETRITKETKNYLIYIQGNKNTSEEYLQNALNRVIENQVRFCQAKLVSLIMDNRTSQS